MFEQFQYLYVDAGFSAHPILLVTVILLAVASVMLFTVKQVKKFVFLLLVILVLPLTIGFLGHFEMRNSIETALSKRGAEITEDMINSATEISYKPIQLALILSILPLVPTIIGVIKTYFATRAKVQSEEK